MWPKGGTQLRVLQGDPDSQAASERMSACTSDCITCGAFVFVPGAVPTFTVLRYARFPIR
ncbi:hypothetical protein [Burkholderia lata]|uniref:hypothetical protein n=1 Tax=Burkholderia lata (strain ATCC 17760 / DSM 23089 / LMG 22485 / NCIMB 9086 / R18194 / 383) TaxID=482957 RepID=UPI001581E9E4|nr:hypothetical protein [Burkholderia lata]